VEPKLEDIEEEAFKAKFSKRKAYRTANHMETGDIVLFRA
jgi:hypothetical protein